MQIHIGCSGWFYWHWRGIFYPDTQRTDTWFKHYTSTFNTVEFNAPFYSWPKLSTVKSWRRNAPEGFRYSVKVNRFITHEKRLVRTRMLVEEFCALRDNPGEETWLLSLPISPELSLYPFPFEQHRAAAGSRLIGTRSSSATKAGGVPRFIAIFRERGLSLLLRERPAPAG